MRDFDDAMLYALAALDPKTMAADAFPEAVLIGGPKDGTRLAMYLSPKSELRFPTLTGIAAVPVWKVDPDHPAETIPQAYHRYVMVKVDGRPSRDDWGAYRYQYAGVVEARQ